MFEQNDWLVECDFVIYICMIDIHYATLNAKLVKTIDGSEKIFILYQIKETSVSSLFESIRWLREPAREERLFGLSFCRPEVASCHRVIMSSYNHVILSSCHRVMVSLCHNVIISFPGALV